MVARLAAAYRQGRLVPFLGAGMSVPACPGWEDFIDELERQAFGRKQHSKSGENNPEEWIRRANNAVRHLRLRGDPALDKAVYNALQLKASEKAPEQTQTLAKVYWPLTLTSNYDDLFYRSWNRTHADVSTPLRVLGRSPVDCRQVLASLNSSRPPILWALQGYVGGMSGPGLRELRRASAIRNLTEESIWTNLEGGAAEAQAMQEDIKAAVALKRGELRRQLVVGHEEYRRVAFTEPQFRRAFAEVFRSRSFLFVGSGLADQYLLNLFGEALEIFGSSPFPHYALVKRGSTDPDFLRSRLNTFVYEYGDHGDLPGILNELHQTLEDRSALVGTWSYSVATSVRSRQERKASDIHLVRGDLPEPQPQECLAVGVRVMADRKIAMGSHEQELFRRMGCLRQVRNTEFPKKGDSLRVVDQPLYLYAISSLEGQPDLRRFSRAITDLLDQVDPNEFTVIRTKLPFPERKNAKTFLAKMFSFAGRLTRMLQGEFPLRFWLMEIIRAYGQWRRAKGDQGLLELAVHLTDPGVLFDMTTGRIDPLELLMCDDLRFTVEVEHNANTLVSESYQCRGRVTLRELAEAMRILRSTDTRQAPRQWLVEVDPSPTGFPHIRSLAAGAQSAGLDTALSDLGVVTDCVLRFVRIPTANVTKERVATSSKKKSQSKKPTDKKKSTTKGKGSPRKKRAKQQTSTKKKRTSQ